MRSIRFAYAIFALLLLTVIVNSLTVGKIIESLSEKISACQVEDMTVAEVEYTALYEKYKARELYISLSVDHDDLSNVDDAFTEIISAAKANDKSAFITAKSRLTNYLKHVKRLSGINIDSVF